MPRLTLGDWTARTIESGMLWLDGGAMFGSVPKTLWSRVHAPDERNRIRLAMRCLLLEGHGRRVLVDVGAGHKLSEKLVEIYRIEHHEHTLEGSLAAAGLAPADITDVILTHLHFDHGGGATRREGDRLSPTFPAARYYVQRRNLENARRPNPRERASYMPENFEPLAEAAVLTAWEGSQAPWPGIEILTAEGHTRGQQLVRVSGGGSALYFVADVVPTAAHVRIPYVMGYDVAALETMTEKAALLGRAADEGGWICVEHDPVVAFGRPVREKDDFGWAETIPADAAAAPQASSAKA